jgi:hypothetical protein
LIYAAVANQSIEVRRLDCTQRPTTAALGRVRRATCGARSSQALEYRTRKRDQLLDVLLVEYGVDNGAKDGALAERLLKNPGFARFFQDVVTAAQPFSQMVLDVYEFLSRWRTTSERNAC